MLRSLEQERAEYAFECIRQIQDFRNPELEGKYKSYVKRAPSLIQTNGLGNTLAFFKSKFGGDFRKEYDKLKQQGKSEEEARKESFKSLSNEKKAYKLLYDHLNKWFKNQLKKQEDILKWITDENTSSIQVFHITKNMIALLDWMKRFADAELKDKEEG